MFGQYPSPQTPAPFAVTIPLISLLVLLGDHQMFAMPVVKAMKIALPCDLKLKGESIGFVLAALQSYISKMLVMQAPYGCRLWDDGDPSV